MKGERAAHYWSRSEGAAFYSMLAAEEARDVAEHGEAEPVDPETEPPPGEVETPARSEPVKRRASGGSNFP